MRIFFISRGFPSKNDPQWGSFEFDQAKALAKLGHTVCLLCVDGRMRFYRRKMGISRWVNDNVICYKSFLYPEVLLKFCGESILEQLLVWQWKMLFRHAIQEFGTPDIIYSHYLFNTHIAVQLKLQFDVPLVAIEHWSELQKDPLPPYVIGMTKAYYHVNKVIAVSESLQKTLKSKFNVEAIVVNNMVSDDFQYNPTPPASRVHFAAAGSLIHRKGYDLLIHAFAKANLPKDKWQLNILGAGVEKNKLKTLIELVGLQNNIFFLGQKNKQEIVKIYQKSDIFALPSRSETFGVVYIEAMACGLPVIATPCGGPEEFITEKNGILVPIEDIDSLAKAIEHMFYHHQEYDQQAIADGCHARFSSEVIAKQLTAIFEDVVAKHKQKQQNE